MPGPRLTSGRGCLASVPLCVAWGGPAYFSLEPYGLWLEPVFLGGEQSLWGEISVSLVPSFTASSPPFHPRQKPNKFVAWGRQDIVAKETNHSESWEILVWCPEVTVSWVYYPFEWEDNSGSKYFILAFPRVPSIVALYPIL